MCTHRGGLSAMSTGGNPTVATTPAAPQRVAPQQAAPRVRLTGRNLEQLYNDPTTDRDMRDAIAALRPAGSSDVTATGITKTLGRLNTPTGVTAIWFNGGPGSKGEKTRQKVLKLLGDGYEFVELTNTNRGNFFGVATARLRNWHLRKKQS